ncbi:MAG TPA: DUF1292 domain-containing protein [Clostridia bacterium]|nr:DUF1292 domain-containing protein [Clostridia bacterium]
MTQENNIVELVDEEGNTISFEYIMSLDYDERDYVVLIPLEQSSDLSEEALEGDEVVILRVEKDENQDDVYVSIEDEEELDDVFDAFSQIIE